MNSLFVAHLLPNALIVERSIPNLEASGLLGHSATMTHQRTNAGYKKITKKQTPAEHSRRCLFYLFDRLLLN
jgi:hypothetical protein